MADLLNKSQGTVWMIENRIKKDMQTEDALRVINRIRKIGIFPEKKELIARFSKIANRGKFYGDYAKHMSRKASKERSVTSAINATPTKQERVLIKKFLDKGTKFQFHGVIESSRKFVVDFVFPSDKNPQVIVEVKDLRSNYRKRSSAVELAYRAIKIRQVHRHTKFIAVINGPMQDDALGIIKEEYDKVLLNSSPDETLKVINLLI